MATVQARLLAASPLSSLATLSGTSVSTSHVQNVECRTWTKRSSRTDLKIRASTSGRPAPPSSPPGLGGTEIPLGVNTKTVPVEQEGVPKAERLAYVCMDCGYVYDLDAPFEEQSDETYNCPVCTAPKNRFTVQNATLGDGVFDVTKGEDASSKDSSSN